MPIRIALDAMGGDKAPAAVVEGTINAVRNLHDRAEILLVGQAEVIQPLLDAQGWTGPQIRVVDSREVIGMGESPAVAVKTKTGSSIHVGLGMQQKGMTNVFISAGNTGAVMAASLFILGRIKGVQRPSVLSYYPTTMGWCIVIDAGTNVDSKPEHLVQFAQMGSVFAHHILKSPNPVVGLMNIGEEPGKGNELVKATYELLKQTPHINFRGNIEGRDLLHHGADVVVCDGFVGNVMLKLGEGVATAFREMVAEEMNRLKLPPDQQMLIAKVLGAVRKRFDYEEVGGAPLLGCNGNVLIMHGSSSARAFEQGIYRGVELSEQNLTAEIQRIFEA